jgi:hypothetical protein
VIELAWDGCREHDRTMGWYMYRAQLRIRPPATAEEMAPRPRPGAGDIKSWAAAHNARLRAGRTASEARDAAMRAAADGKKPQA